jgi:hypothetical protein
VFICLFLGRGWDQQSSISLQSEILQRVEGATDWTRICSLRNTKQLI